MHSGQRHNVYAKNDLWHNAKNILVHVIDFFGFLIIIIDYLQYLIYAKAFLFNNRNQKFDHTTCSFFYDKFFCMFNCTNFYCLNSISINGSTQVLPVFRIKTSSQFNAKVVQFTNSNKKNVTLNNLSTQ